MIYYNQSWFENMWINRQKTVFHKLWQKESRMGPVTFEYLLNLIAQNRKKTPKNPTKFIKAIALEKPLDVASSRL